MSNRCRQDYRIIQRKEEVNRSLTNERGILDRVERSLYLNIHPSAHFFAPLLESDAAKITPESVPQSVMLKRQDLRGMQEEPRPISAKKESHIREIIKQVADTLQLAEEA